MFGVGVKGGEGVALKRSLADRLGRVVGEEEAPPQKGEYYCQLPEPSPAASVGC